MIYKSRLRTQSWAGETIGIIVLDCHYPFIPGNVANATTYDFPVRFCVARGVTSERILHSKPSEIVEAFINAAAQLESEGVKAVTGACGYMARFQKQMASAVAIPVFASSLLQLNFMHQITSKRVGIICAESTCLSDDHFSGAGVLPTVPTAILGMETCAAFTEGILADVGRLDDEALRAGVVEVARKLVATNDDIGSILLECSDLPPYAKDVQAATGLPVFDFVTMINYVHETLARKRYEGTV